MNKSVGNFLFQASQFFATNPRETAYKDIFPKDHMLSLFFKRQEFRKKILEKDEDVEKRKDEQMQRIKQTLQTISQAPQEIPSVSPEAESIVSEYATLVQAKDLGGIDQEQINARKGQINQKFNSFVEKNPAPLAELSKLALKKVGSKVGRAAASKAVTVAATAFNPLVGSIIGFLKSGVVTWIIKNRNKFLEFLGGFLMLGGLILGGSAGTGILISGAAVGGAGLIGEAGGISGSASSFANSASTFIFGISSTVVGAIAIPVALSFIVIPVIVTFILFIINSGAYVVPPAPSISGLPGVGTITTITSPYIDIQKVPNPAGPFKNSDLGSGLSIKYTISIKPKKGALTNLRFQNKCQVIKKEGNTSCDSPTPDKEKDKIPESLDPGNTFEFSYTSTYTAGSFEDSLVLDTFQVTADALPEKKDAVAAGSASVVIGNPPTACFDFAEGWPAPQKGMALQAIAFLSANVPSYMARLCAGGTIKLYPSGGGSGWAMVPGSRQINFNIPGGLENFKNAVYIIAHESGHIFVQGYGSIYKRYVDTVWSPEPTLVCTYPLNNSTSESFPETIADYISDSPISPGRPPGILNFSCLGSTKFKDKYPNHWGFAHQNMINELIGWSE